MLMHLGAIKMRTDPLPQVSVLAPLAVLGGCLRNVKTGDTRSLPGLRLPAKLTRTSPADLLQCLSPAQPRLFNIDRCKHPLSLVFQPLQEHSLLGKKQGIRTYVYVPRGQKGCVKKEFPPGDT
jgi:hypothetical protein